MEKEKMFSSKEDRLAHEREVWKVALDTQMHFNDLLIKMRTTVVSVIIAIFGASAIVVKEIDNPLIPIFGGNVHVSSIVLMVGIVFLLSQLIIDRGYYFKLLIGSVKYTSAIDDKYDEDYEEDDIFGLTNKISDEISENWAGGLLVVYYLIPIIVSCIIIFLIQTNLEAVGILKS